MSDPVTVYVLTALAAVVIVLTWRRLGQDGRGAGRLHVGRQLPVVHTVAGVLALVIWVAFLLADEDTALGSSTTGIIALALWWVVVVAGLLILARWLPARGRHASPGTADTWSDGPGLSILAHLGMLAGVCVFTLAYLDSTI